MKRLLLIWIVILPIKSSCQGKWPITFYFDNYEVFYKLTNEVQLFDTAKISINEKLFFKIVMFDKKGKSYFEAYENNILSEKGFYENSLDTLKKYIVQIRNPKDHRIKVLKYFQPLKNGEWYELVDGKLEKKVYRKGIELEK